MIAINLNEKRIRIRHSGVKLEDIDGRCTYIELSQLWMQSPWLPGDPPFGYSWSHRCIFMAQGWELSQTDMYGDIVAELL